MSLLVDGQSITLGIWLIMHVLDLTRASYGSDLCADLCGSTAWWENEITISKAAVVHKLPRDRVKSLLSNHVLSKGMSVSVVYDIFESENS